LGEQKDWQLDRQKFGQESHKSFQVQGCHVYAANTNLGKHNSDKIGYGGLVIGSS